MRVLVVGENLVDLFKKDDCFEMHVGGSPLNVAVGLARLGEKVSYLTKFSTDFFARKITVMLEKEGVDISSCPVSDELCTTLSFAFLDEDGVPFFEIWNKMTADGDLKWEEISNLDMSKFDIVHFGSILLSTNAANAVFKLIERAKNSGIRIFFDPNYRSRTALNEKKYVENLKKGWDMADVVKCSMEDMRILFGTNVESALNELIKDERTFFVTDGRKGVYIVSDGNIQRLPSYQVNVVDTTGCGDAFMAGLIHSLGKSEFYDRETLKNSANFAQAVAALVARKTGALDAFPCEEEVIRFLKGGKKREKN